MTTARQVLLSVRVMDEIQQFQDGIFLDMESLKVLSAQPVGQGDNDLPHLEVRAVQALADWFGQHKLVRLPKLLREHPTMINVVVAYALQAGSLMVLKCLLRRGYLSPHQGALLNLAVVHGQLEVLEYLLPRMQLCTISPRRAAASSAENAAKAHVNALTSTDTGNEVSDQARTSLKKLQTAAAMLSLFSTHPCRCKVCAPAPMAASVVLRTPHLVKAIYGFQTTMESCSAFQYLYDPCSFECPAQRHTSYFTTTSRLLQPHQPASLAYRSRVGLYIGSGHHLVAHAALTQWRDNGASPRLECLRQVYPHMVAVVVVDALCFGPIDVLQYLHDQGWLRSFHQTSSIFSEVAAAILQPKSVQAFLQDHGYDVPWLYRSSGVGACFQRVLRCKRVARCIVGFQFGVPFALSFHSLVTPDSLLTPDERAWLDKHEHLSPQVAVSDAKRAPIWRYMTLGHHLNAHRLFTLRGTSHSNMKALMEAVIRVRDGALFDVVVVEVLAFGQVSLARWLVKHHRVRNFPVDAMDIAAAANNLSVLTYLHGMKYKCTTDAMDEAARLGHFEVVKFLHLNRLEGATKRAVDLAAANGHIEIVQYLLHRRQEGCTAYALAAARANGHVNIARFLVKSVARFQNAAPTRLDTLVRQAFLLDAFWTLIDSFQQGLPVDMLSLRPLRTLARRFCPKTVAGAASRNKSALRREVWEVHVEAKKLLLPWFQTYGCGRLWKLLFLMPETVDMVSIAALSGGRIDVVQYFHDHGHLFSFPGDAVAVARCHRHDAVSAFLYRCGYAQTCKTSNTPVCPCVLEWNVVHVVGIGLRQGADDRCGLVSKNRATTDVPKQSRVRHGRRTATGSRTSKLE